MIGIFKRILHKWKKRSYKDIDPDEIFLDSKNLPDFDIYQFEGRLEKPISSKVFSIFGLLCLLAVVVFLVKFGSLQIVHGSFYKDKSENNKLKQILIIAPRGTIYSRDGIQLAWNQKSDNREDFPLRKYIEAPGFGNLLGFVKYPAKDKSGFYYEEEFLPKDGAELYLNEILFGENGLKLIEISVNGEVISQSAIEPPRNGEKAVLSVDSRVQEKFFDTIKDLSGSVGFGGGAGAIMDVNSGEILAMVSFPEYSSEVMTEGDDIQKIESYYNDTNNPFLNRVTSGLYTPGSIVKPFLAFAALEEKVITPEKEIISTGKIEIPNPYDPDNPSVFKDWKAHGAVDMRKAISVSSDVYFYEIGGGFGNQKGLGIENIKKYLEMFGFTKKTGLDTSKEATGIIPDPKWKEKTFDGEIWRLGDTYNTAIGQYGMQVTPIQMVVATAALANGGKLVAPSILFTSTSTVASGTKIKGDPESFRVVREGMRQGVAEGGTATGLNSPDVEVAGKTGTAELGSRKQFVNSWVIGFFPFEKPKYAFAVVMERGPSTNLIGATYVMRQLLDWMAVNTPEYLENE
ncbi:MAG: penicillin-binding transpeptidase domain-containing protein [Candidatus Zambryskibacteria bacterium]